MTYQLSKHSSRFVATVINSEPSKLIGKSNIFGSQIGVKDPSIRDPFIRDLIFSFMDFISTMKVR